MYMCVCVCAYRANTLAYARVRACACAQSTEETDSSYTLVVAMPRSTYVDFDLSVCRGAAGQNSSEISVQPVLTSFTY